MSLLKRALLGALFVLSAGVVLIACKRVAERGRFASSYSSYGAGASGTRALLELSRSLGFRAEPFSRELTHLPQAATLVALGGCDEPLARPVSRLEQKELLTWLEGGGLLIVAGVDGYVPDAVGLSLQGEATCEESTSTSARGPLDDREAFDAAATQPIPFRVVAEPSGPPLTYAAAFAVERTRLIKNTSGLDATELLASEIGPLGMTLAVGRGRVVLLGSASFLLNAELEKAGGALFARLLRAFAPEGPVLFDEYHLGMGERRSLVRYLRDVGLSALLLQLGLAVLAFLFAVGARLGPIRDAPPAAVRATQRYLFALGELYAGTRDAQGALDRLKSHGLRRIAQHYRARHVPEAELGDYFASQGLRAQAHYIERIEAHATRPLSREESLLSRSLDLERDVRAAIVMGDA